MLSKIKLWIGGILAGLVGFLWLQGQHRTAQRDKARRERDAARSATEAMKAADDAAERVNEASNEQIKRNNEARAKRADTPADSRFTGRVDLGRLRDDTD